MDYRNNRVLEVDGEIAAHVRIVPKVMRVGRAKLRVAGVGAVGTHPWQQKKGYMAALVRDTIGFMESEGYDLSLLFGIANFYHRFGFASCMANRECAVEVACLPAAPGKLRIRRFRPADLQAVVALHQQHAMGQVGAMERDAAYFQYEQRRWGSYWLVTERRKPIGYVEMASRPSIIEAALPEREDVYACVLANAGAMARAALIKDVTIALPASHPFVQYCQTLGARVTATYRRNAGAMARIINFESWAKKMCREWSARLAQSKFKDYTGALGIACDLGRISVAISKGKAALGHKPTRRVVKADPRVFAQLTFGYRTVANARLTGELDASPRDAELLAAMFPPREAWVSASDRF